MASLEELSKKYGADDSWNGTDKGTSHSYIETYEGLLSGSVGKGITLLEIGVATGKSLLMWEEQPQRSCPKESKFRCGDW